MKMDLLGPILLQEVEIGYAPPNYIRLNSDQTVTDIRSHSIGQIFGSLQRAFRRYQDGVPTSDPLPKLRINRATKIHILYSDKKVSDIESNTADGYWKIDIEL
jgi:hypothetical protein